MTKKELSRRIFDDIYSKGRTDMIESTHDAHCKLRDPSRDTVLEGPEAIHRYVKSLRDGFPDFKIEVERQIVEDDLVATQAICHGTHQGNFMGLPPTNRKVHVRCTVVQRFHEDLIVEADVMWDTLGLLAQMEVAPARALVDQLTAARGERVTT